MANNLFSPDVLIPHGEIHIRRSVDTLAMDVEPIALSRQQEHTDVSSRTKVNEVQDAVSKMQSP